MDRSAIIRITYLCTALSLVAGLTHGRTIFDDPPENPEDRGDCFPVLFGVFSRPRCKKRYEKEEEPIIAPRRKLRYIRPKRYSPTPFRPRYEAPPDESFRRRLPEDFFAQPPPETPEVKPQPKPTPPTPTRPSPAPKPKPAKPSSPPLPKTPPPAPRQPTQPRAPSPQQPTAPPSPFGPPTPQQPTTPPSPFRQPTAPPSPFRPPAPQPPTTLPSPFGSPAPQPQPAVPPPTGRPPAPQPPRAIPPPPPPPTTTLPPTPGERIISVPKAPTPPPLPGEVVEQTIAQTPPPVRTPPPEETFIVDERDISPEEAAALAAPREEARPLPTEKGHYRIYTTCRNEEWDMEVMNVASRGLEITQDTEIRFAAPESLIEQKWNLIDVGNGLYRIKNHFTTDAQCLDVVNDNNKDKVRMAPCSNISGQFWRIERSEEPDDDRHFIISDWAKDSLGNNKVLEMYYTDETFEGEQLIVPRLNTRNNAQCPLWNIGAYGYKP